MKKCLQTLPFLFLLSFISGRGYAASPGYEAVTGFELNRYLGKWYEIARLPNRFEKGLVNEIGRAHV